jgi:hypothetical protein
MNTLYNISLDNINTKIMIILVANESKMYDQYNLYLLFLSKFTNNENNFVPPEFKFKFFIILRQLMSRNDNTKVIKENNIYYVIYNPPKDIKIEKVNYNPTWIDNTQFNNFIINNKIDLNYQDPESGDTIFHDILSKNNYEIVKELLETNNINYNIVNNNNKTPIECIKDIQVASIIINDLNNKINKIEEKLNHYNKRLKIQENNKNIEYLMFILVTIIIFYEIIKISNIFL